MQLPKYSIGVGDRFGRQGEAQLEAVILAKQRGIEITPVWNKSHREHSIIGSRPGDVRIEADSAVKAKGWRGPYFVDADHISLKIVDLFLEASDFFTLDVADWIGRDAGPAAIDRYVARHGDLLGKLNIPGMAQPLELTKEMLAGAAKKFLAAVGEAGRIYRRIMEAHPGSEPVVEVSMDETDRPQTPAELLCILAAVADEGIPAQTIAPRFIGRFNKGVEYVGDPAEFARQFSDDLAVVAFAVERFQLPSNLKLSVHSGSDKFAIYGPMREAMRRFDAGVHLKTAGTTWLEELIGLAAAGGDALDVVKQVYANAWGRFDELCAPYATVIDIDRAALPSPEVVARWDSATFVGSLRHDARCPLYDPNVRQMLHVGYKVAAELGNRYTTLLERHAETVGANVTQNLFERHIRPLFLEG